MKRNFIATSSLVVMSLLLTAAGAYAQSAIRANVPFAFKVGTTQVPAGTYIVDKVLSSNFIMIRNVNTGAAVQVSTIPESSSKATQMLIFHRYGNEYFLSEVRGSAGHPGMTLSASKQERELQVASKSSNTSANVEVASK